MKTIALFSILFLPISLLGQPGRSLTIEEQNKRIARDFYQDLWFTQNTDQYGKYVAKTYVAHDIGNRKNSQEEAIEQKKIADFFWNNGKLSGQIDFQIAEGNLVATRWTGQFEPKTLVGKIFIGEGKVPIINVFKIEDGKIVEFWNHRHDIDTNQTLKYSFRGFLYGLGFAIIAVFLISRLRKMRLKADAQVSTN
jgi:predicted SnoaL-like aldol condensation-catalyzing enzyme